MVSIFLSRWNWDIPVEMMLERNGDIIIQNLIKGSVKMKANSIWYATIEFHESELLGKELKDESIFKIDLNYGTGQLFRMIYKKYNKIKKTWTCYCNHVFFDCQKECIVFDDRTVKQNWQGAIKTANDIIEHSKALFPYEVHGESDQRVNESDSIRTAYWVKYNLIQCLFGSEDNSMMNRWPECSLYRYVAMLDNFQCWFGDGSKYPNDLKPKQILYATTRAIVENTKKVSMEDVATAIIPIGYNGRRLPNEEMIYSDMWDTYKIHRIVFVEYSDIKLKEDDKDDENAYSTLSQLYDALRKAAKEDLQKDKYRFPSNSTTIKVKDLFLDDDSISERIKLNDQVILSVDDEIGQKETFYINELDYDLITQKATSFKLVNSTEREV